MNRDKINKRFDEILNNDEFQVKQSSISDDYDVPKEWKLIIEVGRAVAHSIANMVENKNEDKEISRIRSMLEKELD